MLANPKPRRSFSHLLLGTILAGGAFSSAARASTLVFAQPANPAGGQYKSAWYAPDGLDSDEYVWEDFTLAANTAVTEARWRGAYPNTLSGVGRAPVYDFTVSIYRSIAGGSQPDLGAGGRLVRYFVGGNAGETEAGPIGGLMMYDYTFVFPAPFQATAGAKYWIQIEAYQGLTPVYYWPPDWSIARGTGGNNSHFRRITGGNYNTITGDCAFSLYASDAPTVNIAASASPAGAGTVSGAGAYPINSIVNLNASANNGWGFVNWTENGGQVSTNPHYTFTATVNRTLVANFAPAFTITTASQPSYAGVTSGGGVYTTGSTVTVVATPNHGFVFTGWSDGGTTASHSFPATANMILTAFFASAPQCATFDFDNAPAYTTLPLDLTVDGLSAHFTSYATSGGTYAIWPYDTWGISPPGFSGLSLFPTSIFGADLIVDFSQTLVDFSILYSPQELGCDDSATMRVTVYQNDVFVATNTTTAPMPGTYPSATLSIVAPAGFNRAVVHYDAHPLTCQDWGPIFFADNVTVTRACLQPSIVTPPSAQSVCATGTVAFDVIGAGSAPLSHRWQWQQVGSPGVWTDLAEGSNRDSGGVVRFIAIGVGEPTVLVTRDNGPAGGMNVIASLRCIVGNSCGSVTSDTAALTVFPAGSGDGNNDGAVNGADIQGLVDIVVQGGQPGAQYCSYEQSGDGIVGAEDVPFLVAAMLGG